MSRVTDALVFYDCPECGAKAMIPCEGGETHSARIELAEADAPAKTPPSARGTTDIEAEARFKCPSCGAEPGEPCSESLTHKARRKLLTDERRERSYETRALTEFACPTCGARVGKPCKGGKMHKRRVAKVRPQKKRKGSVWTVSGGGFESNRRKH